MTPAERATVVLRERRPARLALPDEDVAFLLDFRPRCLELRPCGGGAYTVTPRGYVGTLVTPRHRLVIEPKIPLSSLCHLIDGDTPASVQDDAAGVEPGAVLLDFLAARLAELMRLQAARGLHRSYVERRDSGPYLHGRLDLAEQLRAGHGRKDRLASAFEDFTCDVPVNQVPCGTARGLLDAAPLGERARRELLAALAGFRDVSPVIPDEHAFASATPDRLTEGYRPLLDLCRLLADSLVARPNAGAVTYPAFLLNLERVFEQYCTRHITAACAAGWGGYEALAQPTLTPHDEPTDGPALPMRPDVLLSRGGRPAAVIDMKWKTGPPGRADLYQVLAYCAALGCPRGWLVYPASRTLVRTYVFRGGVTIHLGRLRVTGPRRACERGLAELLRLIGTA